MRINNNLMAMNTARQLGMGNTNTAKSMEKLSSGLRINRAGDDAAGLAISEKMRGQIRGLGQASRNAQDGISLVQTAEGALQETQAILQRMRELAVQSANDTNAVTDRSAIQSEFDQLSQEIDRIGDTTEFNTKKLLNGSAGIGATVGAALGAAVKVLGGSGDTTVGTVLIVTASTVATAKTISDADAFLAGVTTGPISFTINGTAFNFATGTIDDDIVKTINDAGIGVVASSDATALKIDTVAKGSAAVLDTTGSLAAGTEVGGADATLTITGAPSYSAQGNIITIQSDAAKGLQLEVTATNATIALTNTLTVDSNGTLSLQIGANQGQDMNVGIGDMRASALGIQGVDVSNSISAKTAITTVQNATDKVSAERAKLGAVQNRLEHSIKNLDTSAENLQAAESRVRDVDMAKEMMEFTKNNILTQAAQAMLAQANQAPQGVLQLLR